MGTRTTLLYRFAQTGLLLWLFFVIPVGVVQFIPTSVSITITPSAVVLAADDSAVSPLSPASLIDRIILQFRGVWIFSSQVIQAVLQMDEDIILGSTLLNPPLPETLPSSSGGSMFFAGGLTGEVGSLVVNTPFVVTEPTWLQSSVVLATTTVTGSLSVLGTLNLETLTVAGLAQAGALLIGGTAEVNQILASTASFGGLAVSGGTSLANLSVTGSSNLTSLVVTSTSTVEGILVASGGLITQGADIDAGEGRVFASNIINQLVAGDSVRISGPRNAPTISFEPDEFEGVESLNGETGAVELNGGTDISISGLTISNTSSLLSVRGRGGCSDCITDSDVSNILTIIGGTIEATAIGMSTPAYGGFSSLVVGTTTASTTLTVYGATLFDTELLVNGTGTSTFAGSINLTDGCFAINGVCLQGVIAPTYLSLPDTPNAFIAGAIQYASSSGVALDQSAQFVFDGSRLAIGTTSPLSTLTVGGAVSVLSGAEARFYDNLSNNYVGFRASSTLLASQVWTLPEVDGASDELLVTDGSGNLRFASAASLGAGVNTFLGLLDTPSSYTVNAIPFASSTGSRLEFSSNLVFDGTRLAIGTDAPVSPLTVQGNVQFQGASLQPGFFYNSSANFVGLGTTNPTARLSIENGSFLQRGGTASTTYIPTGITSRALVDSARGIDIAGGYAYVVTGNSVGSNFHVYDVTRPTNPTFINAINIPAGLNGVSVQGRYAYVVSDVSGNDFHVVDISNPTAPVEVGAINLASSAFGVFVQGRYAYVVTDESGDDFHIIDISIPTAPMEVDSLNLTDRANTVYVQGRYAYVGTNGNLNDFHVIDISSSTNAIAVGSIPLVGGVTGVTVRGGLAYVTTNIASNAFYVLSISNPAAPVALGSLALAAGASDVQVAGRYAYVTSQETGDDFHVIDVAVSATPVLVGQVDPAAGSALALAIVGRYAYVVTTSLGDELFVYDLTGVEAQSAIVHSLEGGLLTVTGESTFAGRASFAIGLQVGAGGVQTDGTLAVLSPEGSSFVGGVGVGTSTGRAKLTVVGDTYITGALRDSTNSAGTAGYVLQSTGSGTTWVATSSLFAGAQNTFIGLSDTPVSYTASRILFTNTDGNALIDSDGLTYDGANLGLGANQGISIAGSRYVSASSSLQSIAFGRSTGLGSGGVESIYIGDFAGELSGGSANIMVGFGSGGSTTGSDNVIVGYEAGYLNSGDVNILLGRRAGNNNAGWYNTLIGDSAGRQQQGYYNELIGFETGRNLRSTSTVAIGSEALRGIGVDPFVANNNVALGYRAGYQVETGANNNILIGYQAASTLTTGANNILIGYDITVVDVTQSNTLNIGNLLFGTGLDGTGTVLATGNVGIGTSTPSERLTVDGTIKATNLLGGVTSLQTDGQGNIIRLPSDEKFKTNIVTIEDALEKVLELRGVSFTWLDEERFGTETEIGFIAQEVDGVVPEVVRKGGDYWSLNTQNLLAVVVEAFKELWQIVQRNQAQTEAQQVELETLRDRVDQLESELYGAPTVPSTPPTNPPTENDDVNEEVPPLYDNSSEFNENEPLPEAEPAEVVASEDTDEEPLLEPESVSTGDLQTPSDSPE
jgi:hypothetical protein